MIDRVAASAPAVPPDTGASIRVTPSFCNASPSARVPVGADELMSTTIAPGLKAPARRSPASSPSLPTQICRTILPSGTMVTITSDIAARPPHLGDAQRPVVVAVDRRPAVADPKRKAVVEG